MSDHSPSDNTVEVVDKEGDAAADAIAAVAVVAIFVASVVFWVSHQ